MEADPRHGSTVMPWLRIVSGRLDDVELAALLVALTVVAGQQQAAETVPQPERRRLASPRRYRGWHARSTARPGVPPVR